MTLPNKHHMALASAESVVRGGRSALRWLLVGVAAFNVSTGCADSNSGAQEGDGAATVGDSGNYSDILSDLADLVSGEDTTGTTDFGETPLDFATTEDSFTGESDIAETQDISSVPDQISADAAELDVATEPDLVATDVAVADVQNQPDATVEDIQVTDAEPTADTAADPSCLQPTGEPCEVPADCEATWALCEDGECMEQDFSNEIAMECCQEYYQNGLPGPLPKGCNPWGPPAPPEYNGIRLQSDTEVA